jgi:hypothetical protein
MDYPGIEHFIKLHLRYKQHWNKKLISLSDAQWQPLENDTFLDGIEYAKGSLFKCFVTTNFGWVIFSPDTLTTRGHISGKRIIKY